MAKECQICGKKSTPTRDLVKLRGKYNPTSKRRRQPNLQWVTIPMGVKKAPLRKLIGKRIKACTKCIKSLSKIR